MTVGAGVVLAARDWLVTPMQVSYAQVLGAGVVLVVCIWMVGTLALWYRDAQEAIAHYLGIIERDGNRLRVVQDELHLCKRTLGRQRPLPRPPRAD